MCFGVKFRNKGKHIWIGEKKKRDGNVLQILVVFVDAELSSGNKYGLETGGVGDRWG